MKEESVSGVKMNSLLNFRDPGEAVSGNEKALIPHKAVLFAVTVRKDNIETVLDRVQDHYGGIEGYLSSSGFDVSQLPELRKKLCIN